jgi:hypothetical protein
MDLRQAADIVRALTRIEQAGPGYKDGLDMSWVRAARDWMIKGIEDERARVVMAAGTQRDNRNDQAISGAGQVSTERDQ